MGPALTDCINNCLQSIFFKFSSEHSMNRCSINSLWMIKSGYVYFSINIITCVLSPLTTPPKVLRSLLLAPALVPERCPGVLPNYSFLIFYCDHTSSLTFASYFHIWYLLLSISSAVDLLSKNNCLSSPCF